MTNQAKEERRAVLGNSGGKSIFRGLLFSVLLTLLVGIVAIFITALLFHFTSLNTVYIKHVGCALGAVTALLGGFVTGKRQRHSGTLSGLLFGLIYTVILLFVGRFFGGEAPLIKRLLGYGIFLLLSVLGGALGTAEIRGHRHGRRRH